MLVTFTTDADAMEYVTARFRKGGSSNESN
jgi:hypothetical protein